MPNFVKIAQKVDQWACRYCIASERWCILISSLFFFCLSRFAMTKFVITETLWSSVIFKIIRPMVSLHRGRFVVVHLYSTFSVNPLNFLTGGKFIPKIAIFRDFWGCRRPTFLKPERWSLVWGCGPGTPPRAKFYKNRLRGIQFLGKFIPKITNFGDFDNGTDLLYHHAKYGGDRGSRVGCRRKSVIFLSVCHALELRSLW